MMDTRISFDNTINGGSTCVRFCGFGAFLQVVFSFLINFDAFFGLKSNL